MEEVTVESIILVGFILFLMVWLPARGLRSVRRCQEEYFNALDELEKCQDEKTYKSCLIKCVESGRNYYGRMSPVKVEQDFRKMGAAKYLFITLLDSKSDKKGFTRLEVEKMIESDTRARKN